MLVGDEDGVLVLQPLQLVTAPRLRLPGNLDFRTEHQSLSGPVRVKRKREMRPRSRVSPSVNSAFSPAGSGSLLCSTRPASRASTSYRPLGPKAMRMWS